MTAAQVLAEGWAVPVSQPRERGTWAYGVCRALFLCCLLSIIFLPEFSRLGGETQSPIYNKVAGGVRVIDLLLLLIVLCHVVAMGCLRDKRVRFPRALALPGAAFLICLTVAIGYGATRGGSNFFFDWRGLALGMGLYLVWSCWLQDASDVAAALRVFLAYMGLRIGLLYLLYVSGQRDRLLGVAIPTFDGPVLSAIVFTGLLAFCYHETVRTWHSKLLLGALTAAAYLIVLLCLRRTYWGELAIGTMILVLLRQRNQIRVFLLSAMAIAIAAAVLGSSFSSRLLSVDVTRDDTEFSADNADHLHDLMDAWSQVRQSPVMGIGLGTSYSTWQIRHWKAESVMVHNAPLHVWLKYGIAGLICYLWFHVAVLRWLFRRWKRAAPAQRAFCAAALAYLAAQFVMTLGFAPWPYSELQMTTLMSFVLAAAVVNRPLACQSCYESPISFRYHPHLQQRGVS